MVARSETELRRRTFAADDDVGGFVGPDRRPLPRDVGHAQQQGVERLALLRQRRFGLGGLGAERLRLLAERRPLGGVGALEAGADLVALPPELVDARLERP